MTRIIPLGVAGVMVAVWTAAAFPQSPFATSVVSYDPAAGQFAQRDGFNQPDRALGAPRGGGLFAPDNTSVVSLGAFGGSITLAFDHTVVDHPLNPIGMDAIVFGNAFFFGGDEQTRWAEAGTIEISADTNSNGRADDAWYLIPGSHIDVLKTDFLTVTWDADTTDATYPPDQPSWLPDGMTGVWETGSYALPLELFGNFIVENPSLNPTSEGIYGYADFSPTLVLGDLDGDGTIDDSSMVAEVFYASPDDPFAVGVTGGSGGGDAFDIAWAVDEETGLPGHLDGFDFIRITSAVAVLDSAFGEISTEVDAVSDVAPDLFGDTDGDEDIDLLDLRVLWQCFDPVSSASEHCVAFDRLSDSIVGLRDVLAITDRMTGPEWGEP